MSINSENEDLENCSHIAKINYTSDKKNKKSLFDVNMENCSSIALEQFKSNLSLSKKNNEDLSNDVMSFNSNVKDKDLNPIDNVEGEFFDNTSVKSQKEGFHFKNKTNNSVFNKKV